MTGIEILAEYTAGGTTAAMFVTLITIAVIGLIILLVGCVCGDEDFRGVGCIVIIASLAMLFVGIFTAEAEHTQYKVTISEDVKLVEFLERYEILDTEGEIYTIREVIPDA